MEKNVLKDFETFAEFPDKYLKIDKNSSYYYIKNELGNYVAKSKFNNISIIDFNNSKKIRIEKNYYSVLDGNLVSKTITLCDVNGKNESFINYNNEICSLRSVLNIEDNDNYYLSKDDILILINFDKESEKVYTKKSGR